jgi:hypothetical protein
VNEPQGGRTLTLEEQRAAEQTLRDAASAGRFDDEELSHRLGLVYKATTPYELWQASDGLAGDPHRGDTKQWAGPVVFYLLAIPASLLVLGAIGWALAEYFG